VFINVLEFYVNPEQCSSLIDDGEEIFSNNLISFVSLILSELDFQVSSFSDLEMAARIQIWLFKQKDLRIEGRIIVSTVTTCIGHWQNII